MEKGGVMLDLCIVGVPWCMRPPSCTSCVLYSVPALCVLRLACVRCAMRVMRMC